MQFVRRIPVQKNYPTARMSAVCRRLVLIFLGAFWASTASLLHAVSPAENSVIDFSKQYPLGATVRGSIVVGGDVIPLPEGSWSIAAVTGRVGKGRVQGGMPSQPLDYADGYLVLAKVQDNRLEGYIFIGRSIYLLEGIGSYYFADAACRRDNFFYLDAKDVRDGFEDCWYVTHFRTAIGPKSPEVWQRFSGYLRALGITLPPTVIQTRFLNIWNRERTEISYFMNPDVKGIEASSQPWASSDWHKSNVKKFPDKLTYLNEIVEFGKAMHDRVRNGFLKRSSDTNKFELANN
jgi:hypothetical protein